VHPGSVGAPVSPKDAGTFRAASRSSSVPAAVKRQFSYSPVELFDLLLSLGGVKFWIVAMYPFYIGWVIGTWAASQPGVGLASGARMVPDPDGFFGLLIVGPLLTSSTILYNAYYDLMQDRLNPRKKYLVLFEGYVQPRTVRDASIALALFGLLLALQLSFMMFLLCGAMVMLSVLYSHPFTRLKAVPGLDLSVNVIGIGILCPLAGYVLAASRATTLEAELAWAVTFPLWYLIAIALIIGGIYAPTVAADHHGDKAERVRTMAVALGVRGALFTGLVLLTAGDALLLLGGVLDWPPFPVGILGLAWVLMAVQPFIYWWFTREPTPYSIWVMLGLMSVVQGLGTTLFLVRLTGGW
jgi:4-hydroxybenzoate polyprenyltransferase